MADEDLNDLQDDNPTGLRAFAERSAAAAAASDQRVAELERREAFRDAGLNPTDPLHQAVINGYRGEIGDVKSFVDGLNLNQPAPIPDEEQAALSRIGAIPSGDGGANPNPEADGNERLKAIVDQAFREKWPTMRFNDTYTAEMRRQGRSTTTFQEVTALPGAALR